MIKMPQGHARIENADSNVQTLFIRRVRIKGDTCQTQNQPVAQVSIPKQNQPVDSQQ